MVISRRADVRREYSSLGFGELTSAVVFAGIALFLTMDGQRGALSLWAGLTPLLLILLQASAFWLLARRWVTQSTMPPRTAAVYRVFRMLNPVLLALGLVGVIVWFEPAFPAFLGAVAWLFGLAEYVNYFVVRLSYPAHLWFTEVGRGRTPRLVKDLAASRA